MPRLISPRMNNLMNTGLIHLIPASECLYINHAYIIEDSSLELAGYAPNTFLFDGGTTFKLKYFFVEFSGASTTSE